MKESIIERNCINFVLLTKEIYIKHVLCLNSNAENNFL